MTERGVKVLEDKDEMGLAVVRDVPKLSGMKGIEEHPEWLTLQRVPLLITAGVPLPKFRVRDLLGLAVGQMIESNSASSEDVSVKVGAMQVAWSEFEVVGERIAVRLTRLA